MLLLLSLTFHFTDNSISEIQGLSSCHRLTHLSLMNNNISRIANLDNLPLKALNLVSSHLYNMLIEIQVVFIYEFKVTKENAKLNGHYILHVYCDSAVCFCRLLSFALNFHPLYEMQNDYNVN